MSKLPMDTSVEAEYEDGFILNETELDDISPYNEEQNVLRAIIDKCAESEHGRCVRFSVFYHDQRYDVDWTTLPDNARPIRFRDCELTKDIATGEEWFSHTGCRFGYQYNENDGKNVQEVKEL